MRIPADKAINSAMAILEKSYNLHETESELRCLLPGKTLADLETMHLKRLYDLAEGALDVSQSLVDYLSDLMARKENAGESWD